MKFFCFLFAMIPFVASATSSSHLGPEAPSVVYGKWARTVSLFGMTILAEFNFSADQTSETVTCTFSGVSQSVQATARSQITDASIAINGTDEESVKMSNGFKCHVTLSPETYSYSTTATTLTLKTSAGSFDFQREN